jgi:hypothetical protein
MLTDCRRSKVLVLVVLTMPHRRVWLHSPLRRLRDDDAAGSMKPPPASGRTRLAIYGMYTRTLSVCPATCKLVIWMLNNLRLCLDADACSFFSSLASGLHE